MITCPSCGRKLREVSVTVRETWTWSKLNGCYLPDYHRDVLIESAECPYCHADVKKEVIYSDG